MGSLARTSLALENLGNNQPYIHPEYQPSLFKLGACQETTLSPSAMSSTTPSVGDDAQNNKTCNTNNSASCKIVTPLTARKKGKGVSMTEELDPEAISPMNGSPIPSHGPILAIPHFLDEASYRGSSPTSTASQSMKHTSTANGSASVQPSSSKATSVPTTTSQSADNPNKVPQKPSSSSVNQPTASSQQPQVLLSDLAWVFREDILNLQTTIQKETINDTQTSSSTCTEGRKETDAAPTEYKKSKYYTIFWDFERHCRSSM